MLETQNEETEKFYKELEELEHKFKDILLEINKATRQAIREIGVRKNVIPIKYILPNTYITRLLSYNLFRQVYERKIFWRYLKREDEVEGKWVRIETYPNIGGIPVEEGPMLKVVVVRIPRRRRVKKCDGNTVK